jgi:hypothetical protein
MALRFITVGIVALSSAVAASTAISSFAPHGPRVQAASGSALLHAYGSRSAQQRRSATDGKFDNALADLSRHAALANPEHVLADLGRRRPVGQKP